MAKLPGNRMAGKGSRDRVRNRKQFNKNFDKIPNFGPSSRKSGTENIPTVTRWTKTYKK